MLDPMTRDLCGCGRPRATAEDLARWEREVPQGYRRSAHLVAQIRDSGGVYWNAMAATAQADPEWSRALCWTKPGARCNLRRRYASDLHIDLAREVFAAYVNGLDEFMAGEGAAAWALS